MPVGTIRARAAGADLERVTFVRSTGQREGDVSRLFFSTHGGAVSNPDKLNALVVEQVEKKYQKLARVAEASERTCSFG